MKQIKTFLAAGAVLAGLAGLGAGPGALAGDLPTATASRAKVENLRVFEGSVEAVNKSTVSAQTAGRIKTINFDVDDYVKAGEIIVTFYDTEHKARLKQAKSALSAAKAQRQAAEQTFKRTEKLFARGTVAKAQFDNAKSAFHAAKAREEAAEAALKQAEEQLAYTVVRAPYSGFVVKRHVQIGEIANPGTPLMTGFSLEKLRVKADVPEQFAKAIRAGKKAVVYGPANTEITASNLTVFPFADPKSNTVTVRIPLPDNIKSVFPGMLVKTAFKIGEKSSILIPAKAVVRRGELVGAYLVDDAGKLTLQQIRVGRQNADGQVEVLSGINEGDKLALDPLQAAMTLKNEMATEK